MNVKIKELPKEERPYEKIINSGVNTLTTEELLAVLLKSGTRLYSAKDLANQILKKVNNINELNDINYPNLIDIKGIGYKKSCVLLAAIELGKRINNYVPTIIGKKLNETKLVYEYYRNKVKLETQEKFYCIYLDNAKKIIQEKLLFIGTLNYSVVHPREVFKEAYKCSASSIICVHNHPSGNVLPSKEDINITKELINVGKILGIKVLDHVIIGKQSYYSFFENEDI